MAAIKWPRGMNPDVFDADVLDKQVCSGDLAVLP